MFDFCLLNAVGHLIVSGGRLIQGAVFYAIFKGLKLAYIVLTTMA
jgi:hypothetical protein